MSGSSGSKTHILNCWTGGLSDSTLTAVGLPLILTVTLSVYTGSIVRRLWATAGHGKSSPLRGENPAGEQIRKGQFQIPAHGPEGTARGDSEEVAQGATRRKVSPPS